MISITTWHPLGEWLPKKMVNKKVEETYQPTSKKQKQNQQLQKDHQRPPKNLKREEKVKLLV